MPKLTVIAICLFLVPPSVSAQNTNHPPRGQAYVFVGAATHGMSATVGFGGEGYARNGLGAGIEIGAASLSVPITELGLGSADLSYHLFPKKIGGNAAPFVSGGYTLFFGHNAVLPVPQTTKAKNVTTSGFNVGGGVDFFATKYVGARFDVRYYGHGGTILHYTYPDIKQFSFVAAKIAVTFK